MSEDLVSKVTVEQIGDVIGRILETADKERKESEPYKNLFGKTSTPEGLIRDARDKMLEIVMNTCTVLKDKYEFKSIPNELYYIILGLPLMAQKLEQHIRATEGSSCCVDKTWHLLGKKVDSFKSVN